MVRRLLRASSGSAAVEMALVAPLLMLLMFSSMEVGYLFYSQHVVTKAVRDGARFASRQGFENFNCTNGNINSTVVTQTQNVTRTDQVASGGTARLAGWTNNNSVSVQLVMPCDNSGTFNNTFYEGLTAGIPVVRVTATVPYTTLFSRLGFGGRAITMTAQSEAPVMGV
jgi:Flp pilus assembly protein TadG